MGLLKRAILHAFALLSRKYSRSVRAGPKSLWNVDFQQPPPPAAAAGLTLKTLAHLSRTMKCSWLWRIPFTAFVLSQVPPMDLSRSHEALVLYSVGQTSTLFE